MFVILSTLQHNNYTWKCIMKLGFNGTILTHKTSIQPLKKVHNMILQQSNIFRSGYTDTQPMYALTYFMRVTVILLCSHTFVVSAK